MQETMLGEQDQIIEEIHVLRSELKTDLNDRFNKIEHELVIMKEALYKSGILA